MIYALREKSMRSAEERAVDTLGIPLAELMRRAGTSVAEEVVRRVPDVPEVDVVLVVGPVSTAALCCYDALPKPVFAPLGIDGQALGLPSDGDASGIENLKEFLKVNEDIVEKQLNVC